MQNLRLLSVFAIALAATMGTAGCTSKEDSQNSPKTSAPSDSNTFYFQLGKDPATLNPITSSDYYATMIQSYVFSSLMERSEDTFEWIPSLAEKHEISKDGKTFTFTIRDGVKWHDGEPLTAEDVKYSFDVYFEGRFDSPQTRVYLEGIKEAKVINPRTVQFSTKQVYFKNFETVAGLTIIPKHFYGSGDPKDPKFNKTLIGTGPYTLESWDKGQKILLKKNPNYFGSTLPYFKERFHIPRLYFRLVQEEAVALELLKKGDLDQIGLSADQYMTKTQGPEWGTKVIAVKGQNSSPSNFNYGFIGWNFKHPFFKDRDVRMAMSHLVNRDHMIEKFLFDMSEKAVGPFGNKSSATSPKVKPVEFDPQKAIELLNKNGWRFSEKGLTKETEGKETLFEFTLLNANKDAEKYWTVVQEEMKKLGIKMNIKTVEWNGFLKLIDERNFDAVALSWSVGSLEPDPKQIWHSASIPSPGSNFVGYSNRKVDKLIDEMRSSMDPAKRTKILRQIHELIAADAPYSFLFNRKFSIYAHTARVKKKQDFLKYDLGINTWTLEP